MTTEPNNSAEQEPTASGKVEGAPLTDAVWKSVEGKTWQVSFEAMHDHAEKLERDLTAAREELAAVQNRKIEACIAWTEAQDQLATLRATSEAMAGALEAIRSDMLLNGTVSGRSQRLAYAALVNFRAATPAQPVPADEADGEFDPHQNERPTP